jgi:Fe-S-cluster containining protein
MIMDEICRKCNALCCRYYSFPIDMPETYEDFDQIRWYLTHEATSVYIDWDGQWFIRIDNRCRWLTDTPEGPRCSRYDERPTICRQFSPATCEYAQGHHECEEVFSTADDLDSYARRMLGAIAFDAARQASRKEDSGNED